jgi:hypothetical protein
MEPEGSSLFTRAGHWTVFRSSRMIHLLQEMKSLVNKLSETKNAVNVRSDSATYVVAKL